MIRKAVLALLTATLGLACTSCGNQAIENNFNRRCGNLRKTTGWLVEYEQQRPAKLEKTVRVIDQQYRHDVQKTFVDNPATMDKWFNREFDRWQERQPLYLKAIGNELAGDLGSLERTIPKFID
jgi:hypothetical protein